MYIAPADRSTGEPEWRPFVEAQGFGHLVAAGRGRDVPVVVPTQFVLDADRVLLHLAGPNPIFAALAEQPRVVLSVAGDWSFIPSAWKAIDGEDPALGIPTTYYAAVQIVGTATVSSDPTAIAEVLRAQLGALQPEVTIADPEMAHQPGHHRGRRGGPGEVQVRRQRRRGAPRGGGRAPARARGAR